MNRLLPLLSLLSLLPPLALIGAGIWLAQRLRRSDGFRDRPEHSLRRFLQYGFLLVAGVTVTVGLAQLLASALPASAIAQRRSVEVALGVALTVVAGPIVFVLGRLVLERVASDDAEHGSTAWAVYLVGALGIGLVQSFTRWQEVGGWLLGIEPYASDELAGALPVSYTHLTLPTIYSV